MGWVRVAALMALGVALTGCGGRDAASADRCVDTGLVMAPGAAIDRTVMVRSNQHAHLWFVAARLVDSRTGVWAVDDPAAPNWVATVTDVARELTPDRPMVSEVAAPDPPGYWVTGSGKRHSGSWRSDMVGITVFTDGAREAWDCVHRDSLY